MALNPSSFFLNPLGLIAAISLVPLIAFYLMRPEPEEQVMPSLAFFMQQKDSGRLQKAMQKLMRNFMLLFHILLILGFTAVLAEPYIESPSTSESTVIVLDRSASMADDMEEARNFAMNNLGKKNTLVVAGNEITVEAEKVSAAKTRRKIESIEPRDVKTDITGALELASGMKGDIVVASDLDQTVNSRDPVERIENMRNSGREVKVMEKTGGNSWGVLGVEPGRENITVEVKNFRQEKVDIRASVNGRNSRVRIEPREVETLKFASRTGKNRVKLEKDEMAADNTAYVSVPPEKRYQVLFISDSSNRYFEKAIELIPFTKLETATPPIQGDITGDIYVVGETSRLLETTADRIEKDVRNGASLVIFSQPSVFNRGFQSLPVNRKGGYRNATVFLQEPVRTSFQTRVMKVKKKRGRSLSDPGEAIIRADYGRGEILFYNVRDQDFNREFLYPVFWKRLLDSITSRPDIEQVNVDTGTEINSSSIKTPSGRKVRGAMEIKNAGFYNTSTALYAANLESRDESSPEELKLESTRSGQETRKKSLQRFGAILLALLIVLETAYLIYSGDLSDD